MLCLFLLGVIFGGCFSTKILVHSSELQTNITPDAPEEEKSYYVENERQLKREREKKREYRIRYYTLTVQKMEYQEEYIRALKEETKEKLRIEEGKLQLGYTVQNSVDELYNQLEEVQSELEMIYSQKDCYKGVIRAYGSIYSNMKLPEDLDILDGDYVSAFRTDNLQVKYYDNQIKNYQSYLEKYKDASNYEDIRIQRDLVGLDKEQYEMELQAYICEKELQYKSIAQNLTQKSRELKTLNEKIATNQILLENGKITRIQLMELETEQKKLIYEKMSLICDGECVRYVLENQIEGI